MGPSAAAATSRTDASPLDPTVLWADLARTVARLRHVLDLRLQASTGLLASDYDLLAGVRAALDGRASMSQLGAWAALSPSGTTRAVSRLIAQGMLQVTAGPIGPGGQDRRLSYVGLTGDGELRLDRAEEVMSAEVEGRLGRHLDATGRLALREVLDRLGDT